MTYLQFHAVFILPWLVVFAGLTLWAVRSGRPVAEGLTANDRLAWYALAAHVAVALVYTTPWDNYLVARGIWGYPEGRVWFTIGFVPIEEYLFFVLQTTLTGLVLFAMARWSAGWSTRLSKHGSPAADRAPDARTAAIQRAVGAAAFLLVAGAGAVALRFESGTYLGLILVWATPVMAFQWGFGGDLLAGRWRLVAAAIAVPTLWLWMADRMAIGLEIWWISERFTTGLAPFGLPVEEATFFLATNVLVVFGMVLVTHPRAWTRWEHLRGVVQDTKGLWWKAVLVLWAFSMVPVPLVPGGFAAFAWLGSALLALGTLGYAHERLGKRAFVLFGIAFVFGVGIEALGSATGVPFGSYAYAAAGPALLGVPLLVPLGWWSFTLVAIASAPARPLVLAAPLALVAWDLGLDPLMVHHGFWAFDPPGAYAGVPWVNFLGWYVAGAALVWLLCRAAPELEQIRGGPLRAVFATQAFFLVFGLGFYGLYGAAAVAAVAMGGVMVAWRVSKPTPRVAEHKT